jgi:ABC-type Fe3+-hydroxamate transport system substrate-binding protein
VPVVLSVSQLARILTLALPVLASACVRDVQVPRSTVADDFGDTLVLAQPPQRIVSLNPTTTELLFAIGAGSRVVGRTSYDIFPDSVKAVPDLGQGLRPNVEAVLAARPDLVILYASNDNRDAVRRLRASGVQTVAYKADRIADFVRVTAALGRLVGDTVRASHTIDSVQATIARVRAKTAGLPKPRVFWPFWEAPLLSVGGGSFINELIEIAGGINVFGDLQQPSPAVTFEELFRRDPDLILTGRKTREHFLNDARWRTLRAVRDGHILLIDTTIVNGPSSRLGSSAAFIARLLHPGLTI